MKTLNTMILMLMIISGTLSSSIAVAFDEEPKDPINSTLINGWGNSAVMFTTLKKDYDLEALGFALSNEKISSLSTKYQTHQVKAIFKNKDFSAESGFSEKAINHKDEKSFFLQGNYKILKQEKFSLLLTAKIESLNDHSIYQFYSNDFVSNNTKTLEVNTVKSYARLGILGQYSISKNWYFVGGVTSTAYESTSKNLPSNKVEAEQTALFGTTYTF